MEQKINKTHTKPQSQYGLKYSQLDYLHKNRSTLLNANTPVISESTFPSETRVAPVEH